MKKINDIKMDKYKVDEYWDISWDGNEMQIEYDEIF
jgi:hypothetical protein